MLFLEVSGLFNLNIYEKIRFYAPLGMAMSNYNY
ncbi:hypothetical protein FHW89_000878 [Mucilaginibacter sp. SG564]|nr:hypothetical protein [Mucilaginibacter sp. SG564]